MSLRPVGLAQNIGTLQCKLPRAVQNSAEVIVPNLEAQSRWEGPNNEEQGGAIGTLAAKEPLVASRSVFPRRRWRPDHRFTIPTGIDRSGATEQPALRDSAESLMELIVDEANMEAAWRNVKRNRGAPGPDGETIDQFFEAFRHRWPEIRQQLLDGTYEPSPVRRKAIDKPDGGQRLLGIPTVAAYCTSCNKLREYVAKKTSGAECDLIHAPTFRVLAFSVD